MTDVIDRNGGSLTEERQCPAMKSGVGRDAPRIQVLKVHLELALGEGNSRSGVFACIPGGLGLAAV